jgi:hypothetical protein
MKTVSGFVTRSVAPGHILYHNTLYHGCSLTGGPAEDLDRYRYRGRSAPLFRRASIKGCPRVNSRIFDGAEHVAEVLVVRSLEDTYHIAFDYGKNGRAYASSAYEVHRGSNCVVQISALSR